MTDIQQADEWVDADKVRALIASLNAWADEANEERAHGRALGYHTAAENLATLLPAPQPRTLAGMSFDELKAYIEKKVTVDGWANPAMLVAVIGDEGAVLAHRWNKPWPFVEVRPLSDLTPVTAPEQEAETTPEPVQPRPEDVPPGEPWSVRYYGKEWVGVRADHPREPWSIISMDGLDCRDAEDWEVALMFRLVPEVYADG